MAFLDLHGVRCYYRLEGAVDKPVVSLSHSLGMDHSMWDPQMPDLLARFRVLRYDLRGHGASDAPAGDYSVEQLSRDALARLDRLGLQEVSWCGLSLGGMIGQWLGVNASDRLSHLVLANTSPRTADPAGMEARRQTVLAQGMAAIADTVMSRFFGEALIASHSLHVGSARQTLLATNPVGYAGCCAAVRDFDGRKLLGAISTPTLVISGMSDASMPWDTHGAVLAREIPGAAAIQLPAAHLSNIGAPRAFTRALIAFLSPEPGDARDAGMTRRREILGDAHVDRATASATEMTRDFQEFITCYAWGGIWTRPGLDDRTRRLLVLATTAAMGRWEEFRMHLAAGLDRDLEWCDVEELLLQTAVYAGVPAANTGFHVAAEERTRRSSLEC